MVGNRNSMDPAQRRNHRRFGSDAAGAPTVAFFGVVRFEPLTPLGALHRQRSAAGT